MYEIEITELNIIDGGVEVFARAWKDGSQLGFGKDGTVDIERFRIFNPPVLVLDQTGDITRTSTTEIGGDIVHRFREDLVAALKEVLVQNIKIVGKAGNSVVPGKIGNTTSTFYPDADPETTTVDGTVPHNNNSTSVWATVQASATGTTAVDSSTGLNAGFVGTASVGKRPNGNWGIERSITGFDTSPIGSDSIDSATVSLYVVSATNNVNTGNDTFFPCSASPASNTSLAVGDYDAIGDSVAAPTAWSTPVDIGAISGSAYRDYILNATGELGINTSGVTNVGWRIGDDITAAPSFSNNQYNGVNCSAADTAGTTQDPKLVVEHSAGAAVADNALAWCNF